MKQSFNKAVIQEPALVALLTAAMEVYPKETFGLVFGSRFKKKFIIKNALTYQNATRKKNETSIWPAQERKVRYVLNEVSGYSIIGDFHSHPEDTCSLSKHDKKDMIEDGEHFAILISVFEWDEKVKWHYDKKEKFIEGTIHSGDFLINIKAYYREPGTRVIRKLRLDCPSLRKLNKWF